ncbi:hypothetical protein M758_6G121000 [Ceratodon purpureus]|uniref:DUF1997 family protein n=1 Tax=Ceratodon purpureus TaxID=3225 RepID=A0A8T0HDP8_CERPU|nr:hypothetical protein KC19_6G125600 [Ceratodon purpureus]KAG0613677.1 hypothetical protein M758_6G121000 [Ceratodon purpureus]
MEALVSISSATSSTCFFAKVRDVRSPSKESCRISPAFFEWPTLQHQTRAKRIPRQCMVIVAGAKQRKAQLSAGSEQTVPLPIFTDRHGMPQPLSQFLQQPAGMKSMLATNYLEDFEYLGNNVFRCYLPKISALGREVAPVMDLLVHATESECVVEMIACKFEEPDASVDKVERFSANLKNHLQWKYGEGGELLLCTNLNINVSIEVHTLPFTMLPLSAVETPGNAVLQAMVDRMVPAFMQRLLEDYYNWTVEENPQDVPVPDTIILPVVPNSDQKSLEGMPL